jgi:uncharacterized membrane protein
MIAERVTASQKAAFVWALAYLCNPFLLNAAAWDFHPVSIAVPFLSLGLLAVERKQALLLACACVMLLACKEHMGLAVAGLGLLYGVHNHSWGRGLSFFMIGITAFILIITVIMPSYSVTDEHIMFSADFGQLGRYSWLGESPTKIINKIASEPIFVIKTIAAMGGIQYLFLLLTPFLFLPLAGVLWILPAASDLLANLLSANQMPRNIYSYHSVTLIPVLTVAAIYGSQRLGTVLENINATKLSLFVLITSIILGYGFAPLPMYGSANYWRVDHLVKAHDPEVSNIQTLIGDGSVSAQVNVASHFSQRAVIYQYPQKVGETDFVILRLESPTQRLLPHDKTAVSTLAYHLMMSPFDYLNSVRDLLLDSDYSILLWQNPWLVLQRGEGDDASVAQVLDKIETLRRQWSSSTSQ